MTDDIIALIQIVLIDVTLAGDNVIVIGMAVAGLPQQHKRPAIIFGILGATIIRIMLGLMAVTLLQIIGLLFAGGLLLLWVCWKMFREIRSEHHETSNGTTHKTLGAAMGQIILADLSMSLDNVLAVAGAAHDNSRWVLAVGLLLSVMLMGVTANLLAHILERARWLGWIGLLIVLYVAVSMISSGAFALADALDKP